MPTREPRWKQEMRARIERIFASEDSSELLPALRRELDSLQQEIADAERGARLRFPALQKQMRPGGRMTAADYRDAKESLRLIQKSTDMQNRLGWTVEMMATRLVRMGRKKDAWEVMEYLGRQL